MGLWYGENFMILYIIYLRPFLYFTPFYRRTGDSIYAIRCRAL